MNVEKQRIDFNDDEILRIHSPSSSLETVQNVDRWFRTSQHVRSSLLFFVLFRMKCVYYMYTVQCVHTLCVCVSPKNKRFPSSISFVYIFSLALSFPP